MPLKKPSKMPGKKKRQETVQRYVNSINKAVKLRRRVFYIAPGSLAASGLSVTMLHSNPKLAGMIGLAGVLGAVAGFSINRALLRNQHKLFLRCIEKPRVAKLVSEKLDNPFLKFIYGTLASKELTVTDRDSLKKVFLGTANPAESNRVERFIKKELKKQGLEDLIELL